MKTRGALLWEPGTRSGRRVNVDTHRRTADGWKIASRVITPLTTPEMEGFEA